MWDFKQAESVYKTSEEMFSQALILEVERLARGAINSHPWAKSFCMAMGSASFGCEWVDDTDPEDIWEHDENLDIYELMYEQGSPTNSFVIDLNDLLQKYNDTFKITGYPMRIIRDNVTSELVTLTDW
jgi:hypothetical protein